MVVWRRLKSGGASIHLDAVAGLTDPALLPWPTTAGPEHVNYHPLTVAATPGPSLPDANESRSHAV